MRFKRMAKIIKYYDYDERQLIKCPVCSWKGRAKAGETEYFRNLFDISCPKCGQMILIISYPLIEEVKEAAGRGDKQAKRDMLQVKLIEAFNKGLNLSLLP